MNLLFSQLYKRTIIPKDKLEWYYKQILLDKPLGSWPPYNYEPLKLVLAPAYNQTKGKRTWIDYKWWIIYNIYR